MEPDMLDYVKLIDLEVARLRNDMADHDASYDAYLAAQNQRRSMQAHLDSLAQVIGPLLSGSNEAQKHFDAIKQGLSLQQTHLERLVKSVPPAARKPLGSSEAAGKVFGIPELLERILLNLETYHLLIVQRVNQHFFNAIQGSSKIQCKMGLKGQEKGPVHIPPAYIPPHKFFCYPETYSCYPRESLRDNELAIRASFSDAENSKPSNPSARIANMLICQPPVKSVSVFTRCCRPSWRWRWRSESAPLETITSATGIRICDLLEAHNRITAEHRLCPDAEFTEHDSNGFVNPYVSFEAILDTAPDDPALLLRKQNDEKRKDENDRAAALSHRMGPYIAAKQSARDNGQPIPTLAEFEAASLAENNS